MGMCVSGMVTARSAKLVYVGSIPTIPSIIKERYVKSSAKKEISEAQYIRDMKSVGVPNEDIDWHLDLYRKTIEIMKNKNELRRPTLQE